MRLYGVRNWKISVERAIEHNFRVNLTARVFVDRSNFQVLFHAGNGGLSKVLDSVVLTVSFRKLECCQLRLFVSRYIYSDTLANEQPSCLIIISLYIETLHDWFDSTLFISRIPRRGTLRCWRDTHYSFPSLFLSLSAIHSFFTHITSIDHTERANFPRTKFTLLHSIRDTPFADSLVLFSLWKFHDSVAKSVTWKTSFCNLTKWSFASRAEHREPRLTRSHFSCLSPIASQILANREYNNTSWRTR